MYFASIKLLVWHHVSTLRSSCQIYQIFFLTGQSFHWIHFLNNLKPLFFSCEVSIFFFFFLDGAFLPAISKIFARYPFCLGVASSVLPWHITAAFTWSWKGSFQQRVQWNTPHPVVRGSISSFWVPWRAASLLVSCPLCTAHPCCHCRAVPLIDSWCQ